MQTPRCAITGHPRSRAGTRGLQFQGAPRIEEFELLFPVNEESKN
jgi:hypothetical protein